MFYDTIMHGVINAFLLIILQDEPEGMSANKISETLTIAPSTVTRFVDKLVLKKYVERIKIGKQSFTKITEEGKDLMPKLYEAWDNIFENIENFVDKTSTQLDVKLKLSMIVLIK